MYKTCGGWVRILSSTKTFSSRPTSQQNVAAALYAFRKKPEIKKTCTSLTREIPLAVVDIPVNTRGNTIKTLELWPEQWMERTVRVRCFLSLVEFIIILDSLECVSSKQAARILKKRRKLDRTLFQWLIINSQTTQSQTCTIFQCQRQKHITNLHSQSNKIA